MNIEQEKRLIAFIMSRQHTPFEWGHHDCCLFVADAIIELIGTDVAKAFRGKYSTELGAAKALKKYGHGDIKSTLNALLGDAKPPLMAVKGDAVLILNDQGEPTLGIVLAGVWVASPLGLIRTDMDDIISAWSVC